VRFSGAINDDGPRFSHWGHGSFGAAVWALDARLRIRHGVHEYTRHPDCIFRMQLTCAKEDVRLSDATRVRPGDRVIQLHLWNEQFPEMTAEGPTLGWGRRVMRGFDLSLCELARNLAARPDLDGIAAIRIEMSLGVAAKCHQLAHIVEHYGFEPIPSSSPRSTREWLHRLGENLLVSMMVGARNPAALRKDTLWRDRVVVYLSRRDLERRHGRGGRDAAADHASIGPERERANP
jgi:hypothetical protein